jgi:DNA-binding NarL/FixJ family response regulator
MAATKIVLVDDHRIMREGLRSCLARLKDVKVVGEAEGGRAALEVIRCAKPHVVVMDLAVGDLSAAAVVRQVVRMLPKVKVIVLAPHARPRYVSEMLEAGAVGYLKKECGFEDLAVAIRAVVKGQTHLGPGVAPMADSKDAAGTSAALRLAPRELQVLQLMAEGKCTKEVALALDLSVKTVETYRKRIMDKLNVHNVAQLTRYAIREGLTPLDD